MTVSRKTLKRLERELLRKGGIGKEILCLQDYETGLYLHESKIYKKTEDLRKDLNMAEEDRLIVVISHIALPHN